MPGLAPRRKQRRLLNLEGGKAERHLGGLPGQRPVAEALDDQAQDGETSPNGILLPGLLHKGNVL